MRSTKPIVGQQDGLVLKASWEHGGSFFQAWEPEVVADVAKIPPHRECRENYLFFKTKKDDEPLVMVYPARAVPSGEEKVTKEHITVDWVAEPHHVPPPASSTRPSATDSSSRSSRPARPLSPLHPGRSARLSG